VSNDLIAHLLEVPSDLTIEVVKLDPNWDEIRNHPRFKQLVEKST
jgi:hypothetical protein